MYKNCFQSIFEKKPIKRKPIWFMRQAGRYLPEYMEIRNKHKDFLTLCYNPSIASQITLQPINRFDIDAAIIFSDILVIPNALGFSLDFKKGEGPLLEKVDLSSYISLKEKVNLSSFKEKLSSVYESISITRKKLSPEKSLIGFAGAPWTLACYMLQGKGGGNFDKAVEQALLFPDNFKLLINDLVFFISEHLKEQIRFGADCVQLFDSWSSCTPFLYKDFCSLDSIIRIAKNVKKNFSSIPFIHFPRKSPELLKKFNVTDCIDVLSVDEFISMKEAKESSSNKVLQGNLSPAYLLSGGDSLLREIDQIMIDMKGYPHIFNLGHGIIKETPIDNVYKTIERIRTF